MILAQVGAGNSLLRKEQGRILIRPEAENKSFPEVRRRRLHPSWTHGNCALHLQVD